MSSVKSESLPETDFSTLVMSMTHSALVMLGVMKGPDGESYPRQPELAHETLDILLMLQIKTAGNLSLQESTVLEQSLADLREQLARTSAP